MDQRTAISPWQTEDFSKYNIISKVGQGTYGKVYKISNIDSRQIYAGKLISVPEKKEGFPIIVLREINILRKLSHENVIKFHGVATKQKNEYSSIYPNQISKKEDTVLIFDYCEHDLSGLKKNKVHFDQNQLKCLFFQLFKGLEYIHKQNITHRDLKLNNLLYTNEGVLKIADFGLAKKVNLSMTQKLQNIHLRAPELFFCKRDYNTKVDMWSAGLIMVELLTQKQLFLQQTEMQVLKDILNYTFKEEDRNCFAGLSLFEQYLEKQEVKNYSLKQHILSMAAIDDLALDLVEKLLQFDPNKRFSAEEALNHTYFNDVKQVQMPKVQIELKCQQFNETSSVYGTQKKEDSFISTVVPVNLKRKIALPDIQNNLQKTFIKSLV